MFCIEVLLENYTITLILKYIIFKAILIYTAMLDINDRKIDPINLRPRFVQHQ